MVLMSRIPTCAWLYVTKTMSNSSSLCGYSSRSRVFTASRACQITAVSKTFFFFFTVFVKSASLCLCDFNLDKRESGSRGEGFVFVLDLVSQILLHSFLLKHLLLPLGPKQDPRRNGDGHCVLWLRLQKKRRDETETGTME